MLHALRHWIKLAWESPTLTTWLSLVTRTLGGVLVLPMILRALDPTEVAVWYLFATILGLNLLLDLGLNPTLSRYVAYSKTGNDAGAGPGRPQATIPLPDLFGAMRTVYGYLGLGAAVLMTLWGTWGLTVPIRRLESPASGYFLWALIVALSPIPFANNLRMAFLNGAGFIAVVRRWDAIFNLFSILSSIIVIQCRLGLIGLVLSTQFWSCITALRVHAIFTQCFPRQTWSAKAGWADTRRILADVWPSSWRIGAGSLLYLAAQQSTGLIYARYATKEGLASYLLGLQVMGIVRASSMAPFYTKLPRMATLWAAGRFADMREIAALGMRRAYWTFVLGAVAAGMVGPLLLQVLGTKTLFPSPWLWTAIASCGFMERFGGMHQNVLIAGNQVLTHKASAGFLVIYAIAMGLTTQLLDVYAFPVAMLVAHGSYFAWYSGIHSYRLMGARFFDFEARCFLPALAAMILLALGMGFLGEPVRDSVREAMSRWLPGR